MWNLYKQLWNTLWKDSVDEDNNFTISALMLIVNVIIHIASLAILMAYAGPFIFPTLTAGLSALLGVDEWIAASLLLALVVLPLCLLIILMLASLGVSVTRLLIINPNANKPSNYDPSLQGSEPGFEVDDFGFFTEIEDGQAKVIVKGQKFVRAIMEAPGLSFRGEHERLSRRDEAYYDVIKTPDGRRDTDPAATYDLFSLKVLTGPYWFVIWLWQRLTFRWFGLVWAGFWPFRKLRIYPIEYFDEAKTSKGEFNLKRRLNYSDHYRVFDFQFFIPIDSVDTKDTIPVSMIISQIMRITNVYRVAFKSDNNWTARLFARIPSVVNEVVNTLKAEDVVSKNSNGIHLTTRLRNAISKLAKVDKEDHKPLGPLSEMGLGYAEDSLTIPDRSFKLDTDEALLGEPARAQARMRAQQLEAKGQAANIRESAKAMAEGGEMIEKAGPGALALAEIEGRVRQAKAAGESGGTVIVGNTNGVIANT
ncbi:MAG: hypothetical protein ACI9SY_000126 [Candidatus Paceibacteria bacterium]|jgi:hypothetical protein